MKEFYLEPFTVLYWDFVLQYDAVSSFFWGDYGYMIEPFEFDF